MSPTSLRPNRRAVLLVALAGVGLAALPAQASPASVAQDVSIPVVVDVLTSEIACDNTGSSLSLSGNLNAGGLQAITVLKNNTKGTKEVELGRAETPAVQAMVETLPKQPVRSGVGGNPYISVGLAVKSAAGSWVLSGPTSLVGRCVQGALPAATTLSANVPVAAAATAQAMVCDSKGSQVNVDASGVTGALAAVVVFDNNINKVVHRSIANTDNIVPLSGGTTHKGWGQLNGAGGNPLVYLRFANATTNFGDVLLGRCKDLL